MRILVNNKLVHQSRGYRPRDKNAFMKDDTTKVSMRLSNDLQLDMLEKEREYILSPKKLEQVRRNLQQALTSELITTQSDLVSLITSQTSQGSLAGKLEGLIPSYHPLHFAYLKRKRAIARGKARPRVYASGGNRRFKNVNFLKRYPGLAEGYFGLSGDLLRALKRTAATLPTRTGPVKVTLNTRKFDFKSDQIRGRRVEGRELITLFKAAFNIEVFSRLSTAERNAIFNYSPMGSAEMDRPLAYSLFHPTIALHLAGRKKNPTRPLILPAMAFFVQKRVNATVNQTVKQLAGSILYVRPTPTVRTKK